MLAREQQRGIGPQKQGWMLKPFQITANPRLTQAIPYTTQRISIIPMQ